MAESINVYCPECRKKANRNKLLFKKEPHAKGKVLVFCRGCKKEIEIDLERANEPIK